MYLRLSRQLSLLCLREHKKKFSLVRTFLVAWLRGQSGIGSSRRVQRDRCLAGHIRLVRKFVVEVDSVKELEVRRSRPKSGYHES